VSLNVSCATCEHWHEQPGDNPHGIGQCQAMPPTVHILPPAIVGGQPQQAYTLPVTQRGYVCSLFSDKAFFTQ
jgi:hypothetical protein